MSEKLFVFDEADLTEGLKFVFAPETAAGLARRWMEHFPGDPRGRLIGEYYEDAAFWRDALVVQRPPEDAWDPDGISEHFRSLSGEEQQEFILLDSGNIVMNLVALTSRHAWERIRRIRGKSPESAHRAAVWMHQWLADLRRHEKQL